MRRELVELALAQAGIIDEDDRRDAVLTSVTLQELEFQRSGGFDILYPELKWAKLIPVDTSVPAGADTIAYEQWDETGEAKIIANGADDLPFADAAKGRFSNRTVVVGAAYKVTQEDLLRAQSSGVSIENRRQRAAINSISRLLDKIAALGEPSSGIKGLLTHDQVPVVAATAAWSTLTATQLVGELHRLEDTIWSSTSELAQPDTLILPTAQMQLLRRSYMSLDNQQTVLGRFLQNAAFIKNVESWSRATTAGVGGVARAMAYKRDPAVLQIAFPVPLRQLPPQPRNLALINPMFSKIGGLEFYYPKSALYMDGI
jgi:hypothetical protein